MKIVEQDIGFWKQTLKACGFWLDSESSLHKCISICQEHGWDSDTFINKYESHVISLNIENHNLIDEKKLVDFERRETKGNGKPKLKKIYDIESMKALEGEINHIMGYNKRMQTAATTENNTNKHGQILISHNPNICVENQWLEHDVVYENRMVAKNFKCMFSKPEERYNHLNNRLNDFGHAVQAEYGNEWSHPMIPTTGEICIFGRISKGYEDENFDNRSVTIEMSKEFASGMRMKCVLDNLRSYSLIPGQMVSLKGHSNLGRFHISEIQPYPRLPFYSDATSSHHTKINVFVGPFVRFDTNKQEMDVFYLDKIMERLKSSTSCTAIFMGPFLDSRIMQDMEGCHGNDTITEKCIFRNEISVRLNNLLAVNDLLKLVLIPNIDDNFHYYCYPQPPMDRDKLNISSGVFLLQNPSIISINDVYLGLSTIDSPFDLSKSEMSKSMDEGIDDLDRLLPHILHQRCFYPMFPPSAGTNIDYSHIAEMYFEKKPNIFVIPTKLGRFIKWIDGVAFVSLGQTVESESSCGSYLEIHVLPELCTDKGPDENHDHANCPMEEKPSDTVYTFSKRSRISVVSLD